MGETELRKIERRLTTYPAQAQRDILGLMRGVRRRQREIEKQKKRRLRSLLCDSETGMKRLTGSAESLRTLPILSSLTAGQFARLLPSVRRRSFSSRACILSAGEPACGLYIILLGRVRLRHQDQEGRALTAATFGPREFFGEMGLIGLRPDPASVEATEDCEVVYIGREALLKCLNENAAAAMCMLRVAITRLSRAHRQMANLAFTNVYGRVAQVLVESGHEVNGEWHVDPGSEQIASMVGASREMVSRVLKCMIEKHLLRRDKRRLIVLDGGALVASATGRNSRKR
jgi:CRP-like cAMP-binding protein